MIGNRIRRLREANGYTQEEFGKMLGEKGKQQVYKWEKGDHIPNGEAVAKIARALNVTTDYLLGLTNDPQGHITEDDLSPMERLLVNAYRRGDFQELMRIAAEKPKPEPHN